MSPGSLPAAVREHPCYAEAAHHRYARLHLPVAPRCNLLCAYCDRRVADCAHGGGPGPAGSRAMGRGGAASLPAERRPGLTARILAPRDVPALVKATLGSEPRLRVIGIAGPGEPLANPETFEALALARQAWAESVAGIDHEAGSVRAPAPAFCLATNGYLLAAEAGRLAALGVTSVTVTMSAVTPAIAAKIYLRLPGGEEGPAPGATEAGAARMVERQLAGIRSAAAAGLVVKVNTVLIPGISAGDWVTEADEVAVDEVARVALAAARAGAYLQNITPLIPLGAFAGRRAPSCDELRRARDAAGRHIRQFRLCRQCRADAAGVPGEG